VRLLSYYKELRSASFLDGLQTLQTRNYYSL